MAKTKPLSVLLFDFSFLLFFLFCSVVAERQTKTMIYVGVVAEKKTSPTSVSFVLFDLSVFPLCFSVCPLFLGSSSFRFCPVFSPVVSPVLSFFFFPSPPSLSHLLWLYSQGMPSISAIETASKPLLQKPFLWKETKKAMTDFQKRCCLCDGNGHLQSSH